MKYETIDEVLCEFEVLVEEKRKEKAVKKNEKDGAEG